MLYKNIYESKLVEKELYSFWLKNHLFDPIEKSKSTKNFSIVLPPPNVTGHLHIGHALDFSIQDVIIRYKKLQGFRTIWIPGADHAGIATQTKFEKILKERKIPRHSLTDQEFLTQLNKWALEQADFIHSQEAKMGFALSYKHEAFTLDKNIYDLIYKEFVALYKDGLIYRANKLVNWDIKLQTAISDIEVEYKITKSKMYYFKYFLQESPDNFLIVATTRPETMFVDTNLFVNPDDKRYSKYIGKHVINPINGEVLQILSDHYIDINFGTGVMKCTPAHDFNDYALAQKFNIKDYHSVIDNNGKLNKYAKTKYADFSNIDRIVARDAIVADMSERGLVYKTEEYENNVGISQRTGVVIEPLLSLQWFVKMKPIVKQYRLLNKKNPVNFFPNRFKKTLDMWLNNIQDWCISRHLLYGHTIPAWYHKTTNEIYVGTTPPKNKSEYIKETDVLDTWFSSGLWPLALTKYAKTKNLGDFYPIDVLVTGHDIIYFWVARMLFQCSYIDHSIPLKNVILHGLVRDENNQKMSKSLGNVVDPMNVIEEYGADALRLFLLSSCPSSGQDIKFSQQQIKYYWSFLNKIWNCANLVDKNCNKKIVWESLHPVSKWIINKFNNFLKTFTKHFEKYNFILATKSIFDFVWNDFCNMYLELKNVIPESEKNNVIYALYKNILVVLHPFVPFITEYIYQDVYRDKKSIMLEAFPKQISSKNQDLKIVESFMNIVSAIRSIRIKHGIKNVKKISFYTNNKNIKLFSADLDLLNISILAKHDTKQKYIATVIGTFTIYILNDFEDENEQKINNEKILQQLQEEITRSENILSNKNFILKAPKEKVEIEKQKLVDYKNKYKELLAIKNKNN